MDIVKSVVLMLLTFTFWLGVSFSAVALIIYVIGFISISLNSSILADIGYIIQMWLPFNLNIVLTWVVVMSGLYVTYRLSMFVYNHAKRLF